MDNKCYFWVLNNLDKYSFKDKSVAIKQGILWLLQHEDSLDNPTTLQKLDKYYQQLTENFYNNFVGYRNGLASKSIVSSDLDCYFINTADGMVPIGYYKELRPVEAAMIIQRYLKNCEENIPFEQDELIKKWESDKEEISDYYIEKKNKKHSSPAKCIWAIVVSVIYLLMTAVAFLLSRGFSVIFTQLNAELIEKIQRSMPCLRNAGASDISSFVAFLIISGLIVFAFLVFSLWEFKLALDKQMTDQLLDEFDINIENMKAAVKDDIDHQLEEAYIATRQGKSFKTNKTRGANAVSEIHKKIKIAKTYSIRMHMHSDISILVVLAICTCIMAICCFTKVIPAMQDRSAYREAERLLEEGNYDEAISKFKSLKSYKDSETKINECMYQEAKSLLEEGIFDEAREIFDKLDDYEDASTLMIECDYKKALSLKNEEDYITAYKLMLELGEYKDAKKQAKAMIEDIYNQGVSLYRSEDYSAAKECFNVSKDFGRENDYLTLIKASQSKVADITALYALIDFEDSKEVLLNNYNIYNFLKGEWRDAAGRYVRYYDTDSGTRSEYNLKSDSGSYYKLEDACHKVGNGTSYSKQWSYKIIDINTIEVYNYQDYQTYRLQRR